MKEIRVNFSKRDDEKQIVYGEVYSPMFPDSQGDFMTAEKIEQVAHNFLKSMRVKNIDIEHDLFSGKGVVVESFVARKGDPDFMEGSWVLGTHIPNKDTWGKIKSGEIGGYSMYGTGRREPRVVEIEIPDSGTIFGKTEQAPDGHTHLYAVDFDEKGNFLGGETDEAPDGHWHDIKKGTVTEFSKHGRHRFDFMSLMKNAQMGYSFPRKRPPKRVMKDDMSSADFPARNAEQKEAPAKKKKKCKDCGDEHQCGEYE